jgi:hypothetical protein
MSDSWWSIEARDGLFSAHRWRDAFGQSLVESAITNGARQWNWDTTVFGVVFEVAFGDDEAWERFRHLPAVVAALDAVPMSSLYVYPGRGGSAGAGKPRHPKPTLGEGAAPLPIEPVPVIVAHAEPPERHPEPLERLAG